jgi:NAD(P)-dependent dehydrogenase (short-subunit alcohol dehydrogenase family)
VSDRERLKGRVAVVTGASSGIGRAIARLFAAEGASVVLADISQAVREGGASTESLITTDGHRAAFVATDVSSEDQCEAAIAYAVETFGSIDILVNNAASPVRGTRLTDTSLADWRTAFAVNLDGVFLMTRAALRRMLEQPIDHTGERGRIVNISSQHGMIAAPEDVAYGTSKAGVVYFTRQIAIDYAADGIICNAVAPGKILTGKTGRAIDPKWMDYSRARTALPRLGTPEDVARAALFLASPEATFITGENLMVDGGWMAG